jgi:cardiolipin synthase A/B
MTMTESNQQRSETVFSNGDQHFEHLVNDINTAKSSIELETYIFQKDHLGIRIAHALTQAAQRGVNIRILVDGAGTPYWGAQFAKTLEAAGAHTRVFHPFPWQLWNWSRATIKLPILLKGIFLLLKANYRNHRKVCIIDNTIAYVGSLNITKCHLSRQQGGDGWRDSSIRLCNIDLAPLLKAFNAAWSHRTITERVQESFRQIRRNPVLRLNYTRHRRRILHKQLLRRIMRCHDRIWITNAYFVPDNFLLRRLREAAKAGTDVRILLPKKSDVMVMPWTSSTFYYRLLKAGVRIFEYIPSNLHAKLLILDNWMLLGSSNLNHRSLLHDLEVDINVREVASKKILADQFLMDLTQAKEITFNTWKQHRPWRQRIIGQLVLYLKYWI